MMKGDLLALIHNDGFHSPLILYSVNAKLGFHIFISNVIIATLTSFGVVINLAHLSSGNMGYLKYERS